MNNQGYFIEHINKKKVEALADMIKRAVGFDIVTKQGKVDFVEASGGILICAVDDMSARKSIFEQSNYEYFIDTRMGAEYLLQYCVKNNAKDFDMYQKTLYTNEEASHAPCTAKSTYYTASLASANVAKMVKDIVTGHSYTRMITWNVKENAPKFYEVKDE